MSYYIKHQKHHYSKRIFYVNTVRFFAYCTSKLTKDYEEIYSLHIERFVANITMGIGYRVHASCFGTSFYLRFQACLTVYSQVAFSRNRTIRDEHFDNVVNCIKSRIVRFPRSVIDVQMLITKTYERYSNYAYLSNKKA